jgi:hypothetical protein
MNERPFGRRLYAMGISTASMRAPQSESVSTWA